MHSQLCSGRATSSAQAEHLVLICTKLTNRLTYPNPSCLLVFIASLWPLPVSKLGRQTRERGEALPGVKSRLHTWACGSYLQNSCSCRRLRGQVSAGWCKGVWLEAQPQIVNDESCICCPPLARVVLRGAQWVEQLARIPGRLALALHLPPTAFAIRWCLVIAAKPLCWI